MAALPILFHIPHSSTLIPPEEREAMVVSDVDLQRELLAHTDRYTDGLFAIDGVDRLVFPVSRLVVDPERFREDSAEKMAERGYGAVYTRTHDGRILRMGYDREAMLQRWYDPHHRALDAWGRQAVAIHGHALIVDCHSFPSIPLPGDIDQDPDRPEACVGTDGFHTPDWLLEATRLALSLQGWSVGVDRPYSGTMVPSALYQKDNRLQSVMVEVNRRLYMDEGTGERLSSFETIARKLRAALAEVLDEWRRRGNPERAFQLQVADNFHHMDEQEQYPAGEFSSYEEALAEARRITERSVVEAEYRYETYTMFGEDPFISPSPFRRRFSAWDYAAILCEEAWTPPG